MDRPGSEVSKHWAFITPTSTELPDVDEDWGTNEIDRFILAKMEEKNLSPGERADAEPPSKESQL